MRVALVSGDGLPVSGLLTSFRNAMQAGVSVGLVDLPIEIDHGYAWRPDKPAFFPDGPSGGVDNPTLVRPPVRAADFGSRSVSGADWTHLRRVAAGTDRATTATAEISRALGAAYRAYFESWWKGSGIDVVVAVNMTLSDAVPVTAAMYRAADSVFGPRTDGGLVVWDHDLFGSCAVRDDDGTRYYPARPTPEVTLPPKSRHVRWCVVSEELLGEAVTYGLGHRPALLPNVLPPDVVADPDRSDADVTAARLRAFRRDHGLPDRAPIHLDPVRVFRVKGVELALRAFAGVVRSYASARNRDAPVLLIFGGLGEDPDYGAEVQALAAEIGVAEHVRFLDGVPLASGVDAAGRTRLDETDLLRLAQGSGGGVLFTPNVPDVETIGLGPALAAIAGIPCLVTEYQAFEPSYGPDFSAVQLPREPDRWPDAIAEYVRDCAAAGDVGSATADGLARNRTIVAERFPSSPWTTLLASMAPASTVGRP